MKKYLLLAFILLSFGAQQAEAAAVAQGQQAYTTPGTYSWVAPAGVTSVSVVCVGAGASANAASGGGGGALAYANNITVVPGSAYTVVVAASAVSGAPNSSFNGTTVAAGSGNGVNGGAVVYGTGGVGGAGGPSGGYSGGGGAGGYAGAGGNAGYGYSVNPTAGAGGAGAGGGSMFINNSGGGGGGGVGIFGEGASGVPLNNGPWGSSYGAAGSGGGGGSGGTNGNTNSGSTGGDGGSYGGGGGAGMYLQSDGSYGIPGSGAGGAVRIIWGPNRSFPSTNTVDMPVVVYTLPVVYAPPYAKFKFLGGHFSFRGGTFKFNYTRNTPPPPAITYIENVFSAYTYTGNGTSQTITNGINLSVDGGLVWIKDRTVSNNPVLNDTTNGIAAGFLLTPSTLGIQVTSPTPLSSFNSNGFSLNNYPYSNTSGNSNVSWTFRKAPKFFDIVQYTGNGTTQTIAHNLGIQPGMVVIKRTDSTGNWPVWHIGASSGNYLMLNTTAAQTATGAVNYFGNNTTTVDPNAIDFTVGNNADVNASGGTYIAYLYANDTSVNGLIQCGSASDTAGLTVTLGWEPQYILWKTSAITSNWMTFDTSRGQSNTSSFELDANTSGSDGNVGQGYLIPTATGFRVAVVGTGTSGTPMIYCAIRRGPMQQPTSGTQVYNAIARVGTGAIAQVTGVGFPPDLMISATRATWSLTPTWGDRLRGTSKYLLSANASSEIDEGTSAITSFNMDGVSLGNDSTTDHVTNGSGYSYINWFFRRYPGVFDEVAYTGDGTHSHAHNLGVIPEMVIEKSRSSTENWVVSLPSNKTYSYLNSTNAFANLGGLSSTATTFAPALDTPGTTYVAYLFASKPGVSKVGSYTGNGGTLNINANFTAPARFILIKRTDSTGDWYVWDSTRGLVAGSNNPHLSLNTTAAEVTTDDSVDPYVSGSSSGFTVKQNTATNINVSGGTYIYLAFQ